MSRFTPRVLLAAFAVSLTSTVFALGIRFDPEKMMRASEVRRGMEGYGLTVFHGTEPTKFRIRILGVLPQGVLGQPYIIFRVLDGPLVERDCPVMGGMSGSPVFINEKLIGAIAYTYPYEKEPCGGITGIEAMIEGSTGERLSQSFEPQPVRIGNRTYSRVALAGGVDHVTSDALPLEPIASPLYFSAGTERGNGWQRSLLGVLGLDGVPGAASHEPMPADMKPGAGLGLELARGDFLMYTFGTLTWREGDSVIGFGHPFMGKGDCSLPLTSVYIHDFVASYRRTDKDGVIMDRKGTITTDCPWAVGGTIGAEPKTVPGVYRIVDETKDRERTFSVQMAYDRTMTPSICLSALFSSVDALYHSLEKPGVVSLRYRITGSNGTMLQRSDVYYHGGDPVAPVGSELSSALRLFTDNRFQPQDIADFSVEVRLRTEQQVAVIERVYTDEEAAVAGGKLTVHVLLKPVDKPLVEKVVTFDLPWELPKSGLRLGVAGGEAADYLRRELGGFTPEFHSLDRVITYLQELDTNDRLLVMLSLPTQGVAVEDIPLPGMPGFVRDRLSSANRTGVRTIRDYDMKSLQMPWVVQGRYLTTLPTVTRSGERGKPTPPKPKESSAPSAYGKLDHTVNSLVMGSVQPLMWAPGRVSSLPLVRPQADAEEDKPSEEKTESETPAAESEEEKEAEKTTKEEKPGLDQGKVLPKIAQWSLAKYDELAKGEPRGLAIHCEGRLVPGLVWEKPVDVPDSLVWDIAIAQGRCYVAAGLEAKVYVMEGEALREFFRAPEGLFVSTLIGLPDGSVACATVPDATLYVVGADGKIKSRKHFEENYIWDILRDDDGLWVATGRPGLVYKVTPDGTAKRVAVLPEEHVTALAARGSTLYAATVDRGGLYRISSGAVTQLIARPDEEAVDVAVLDDGSVALGLYDAAAILGLSPDGSLETWYEGEGMRLYGMLGLGDAVVAGLGTPASMVRARGRGDWELVTKERSLGLYAAFALDASKRLWAAGGLPGTVAAQRLDPEELVYISAAQDAKQPARWLQIFVDCQPDSSGLRLDMRTGASPYFDSGLWSAWSGATRAGVGYDATSPTGRYCQLRVTAPPTATFIIRSLAVNYRPQNTPPTLKVSAPTPAMAISGEFEIKWETSDPDEDSTQVNLSIQRQGQDQWQDVAKRLTGKSHKWDTKKLEEGVYTLRCTVSDLPSRPEDAAEQTLFIGPLVIDNTAPKLEIGSEPSRLEDGSFVWELLASDGLSGVATVAWQYPGEEVWYALAAKDEVYGGRFETCRLLVPPDIKPATKITVRVRDLAGNSTDLVVTVPEAEKAD